jgi:hypothetical protein
LSGKDITLPDYLASICHSQKRKYLFKLYRPERGAHGCILEKVSESKRLTKRKGLNLTTWVFSPFLFSVQIINLNGQQKRPK